MDDFFDVPASSSPAPSSGGFEQFNAPSSGGFEQQFAAPSSGGFEQQFAPSSGGFEQQFAPSSGGLESFAPSSGGFESSPVPVPFSSGSGSVYDDPSLRSALESPSYNGGYHVAYDTPALQEYESKQAKRLEDQKAESQRKLQEIHNQAQAEIQKQMDDRRQRIQKAAAANRANEKKTVIPEPNLPLSNEEAWSRVGKLVELHGKAEGTKDVSRLREVLQSVTKSA